MIIAIDGPAASGKGTIAKELAKEMGFVHLDSGLFYRLFAYHTSLQNSYEIEQASDELLRLFEVCDVSELRSEKYGKEAAKFAQLPHVRLIVNRAIEKYVKRVDEDTKGVVIDGRDIGTIVAPNARVKLFVFATPEVRARRRFNEGLIAGSQQTFEEVLSDIRARDERDSSRQIAPLKQAEDADLLDTSDLTIGAAVQRAIALVEARIRP